MQKLLDLLKTMPEYRTAVESLACGESVAITGIGQINRTHILA